MNVFGIKKIATFCSTLLLLGSNCVFSYEEQAIEVKVDAVSEKDNKFEVVELNGNGDVCQWVIDRFDFQTGELKVAYDWVDVKAELLEYPKEYFSHIKYLAVDIDNYSGEEYLVKMTTYLGGTLSALNLVVTDKNVLFKAPVSVEDLLRNSKFSLNEKGKERFLLESSSLRQSGVAGLDPRLAYGYSAYQLQNKLIDVFNFKGKNYFLLNNYLDSYGDKLGLVVAINNGFSNDMEVSHICFFKNKII